MIEPRDYHSAAAVRRELLRPTDAIVTDISWSDPSVYEIIAAAEMLLSAAGVKPGVRVCPAKRVILRGSTLSRSPHQAFVNRILAYVNANACNRIGVDDIAAHFRVSRRLLDLRFQENGAGSVLSALMARRIEKAKRRLLASRQPISQIVEDCGYESLGHFKSVFKRATGMSMRDFRKSRHADSGVNVPRQLLSTHQPGGI